MTSPSSAIDHPSRFFEHLSPNSPTQNNFETELSKFSPDTPPQELYRSTMGSAPRTSRSLHDIPEDVESLRSHRSSKPQTARDRLTKVLFDFRTLGDGFGEFNSVAIRPLSPLPLLNAEKERPFSATYPRSHSPPQEKQKKRRSKWCTFLLVLIILALLGNIIFLNVRVVELTKDVNGGAPSSPNPSPDAVEECLSQFTINAPSDPSAYPCSTCLPILSSVTNSSDAANAVQFCGLRAILESTSTTGRTALSNGGWSKSLRVCTWSGVSCSDSGLVTSL